ncbi:hypothetical protein PAHAL_4G232600 [Panicum hallii]|uniref:Peptidase A1 domain-containing protein n=1 Tax=Panicum hallii TaxID=206008 RepID=A0A2S3HJN5_9POAL|nr:aspartyl protease family protein At5g10770-like [Panicum hallii]PAN24552.1 hypothetical protein PAHAL_4G232600 [Panicum hallii]
MAASHLFVCIILCTYYSVAHGGDDEHGFVTVLTSRSFQPEAAECSTTRVNLEPSRATVSLPLAHWHGPCAPLQTSEKPSFTERLRRSRARANYIRSRASTGTVSTQAGDDANVTIPAHLGGSVDSLEYVVTMGLGTPPVPQVVLMDTGSDLSWVQCAPCNSTACYPQKDPLFDPSKSSSYAAIPCSAGACRNLTVDDYGDGCVTSGGASQCAFAIEYGDGSHTRGVYSKETLTLAPGVTVEDFHFGCADDQEGSNDKYDGLIGLGGAPESLVVQTSSVYGSAFSYCLPAQNSEAGFLALGGAPSANTSGFLFTPMRVEEATFYVVTLTGVSVGGKQLDIPPVVFSHGMIVDSGTVITELPHTAYAALRSAFRSAMSAYPLLPPSEDLDTCYNLTGFSNVTVPTVALTFDGGATMDLDVPNGILLEGCLAFQEAGPDDFPGILGNVNQRTFEVHYDVSHGKVGFRAGAC